MIKQMKLKCRLRLEDDRSVTAVAKMHDGTSFEISNVNEHEAVPNENYLADRRTVDGWLFVIQEAKQGDRCYLTLPKPSLTHGKQVIVQELDLMPAHVSLKDFNPQTKEVPETE